MKTVFVATAAALFALAGAAQAGEVTLTYSDNDLASDAAVGGFYGKIEKAAWSACDGQGMRGLEEYKALNHCRAFAVQAAVEDVDHDRLWAHHGASGNPTVRIAQEDRQRYAASRIKLAKAGGD